MSGALLIRQWLLKKVLNLYVNEIVRISLTQFMYVLPLIDQENITCLPLNLEHIVKCLFEHFHVSIFLPSFPPWCWLYSFPLLSSLAHLYRIFAFNSPKVQLQRGVQVYCLSLSLQVIVWGDYGRMDHKCFMGVAQILLEELDLSSMVIGWYKLFPPSSLVDPTLTPLTRRASQSSLESSTGPPCIRSQ